MNKIEFDETAHKYKLNANHVPSVTQIISETIGHGWSAEDWYLQRGRAIHACADFIAQGKQFKYDERIEGYVKAIQGFFDLVKPSVIGTEKRVASKLYQYAGTIDLIFTLGLKWFLIDWKHSIDKNRIPLQLGGYSQAFFETEGKKVTNGYGVQIKENGTFSMTEEIDLVRPTREFLALRTTYSIKDRCKELSFQKDKNHE